MCMRAPPCGPDGIPHSQGTHFKVPWLQEAIIMDIRSRPREIKTLTVRRTHATLSSWRCCGGVDSCVCVCMCVRVVMPVHDAGY